MAEMADPQHLEILMRGADGDVILRTLCWVKKIDLKYLQVIFFPRQKDAPLLKSASF
jgi:hypothetical protein